MKAFKRFFALALGLALAGTLAHAQKQISGPYLWVIAPTEAGQGGANSTDLDQLAAATDGAVTEDDVAANGANEGDQVGGYAWTSIQLPNNGDINAMLVNAGVTDNEDMNDVSAYALINLESPRAQENVLLACGSDDSIKIWLNGKVVHKNAVNRGRGRYQDLVRVNLKAGSNRVLVKVSERTGGWGMHFGVNAEFTAGGVTYHPEEISIPDEIYIHDLAVVDPDHSDLVLGKSVGRIGAVSGFGTGFLVAPNKILSNRHVIGGVAKTHLPVWMTKHETDGPVHGYIAEVIFAHEEYDMAVGVVNWTRPDFEVPAPLTLMRSSEFDSRVQSAGGNVRIKTIGHSGGKPKTRQIGDYVKHNNWIMAHYPVHAPGGSGSPVFFENGNAVVGVATGIANWTESRLFHDQRHDYFGDLKAVIQAPLDPTAPKLLAGHASGAKSAAYSPNGQAIAVGSGDAVIRVWNANWSGVPKAPIHTLRGHTAAVLSVAYSPNGQTIVSGSADSTVQIWNAGTGAKIRTLRHSSAVTSVAYSPNGQTIAAGGVGAAVRLWNANTGVEMRTLEGHTAIVWSVAYSPDGQTIASGSADSTVRLWNAGTGAPIRTLPGHTDDVNSIAYSPNGQTIVSGSADDTIRVWNAGTGAPIRTLQGHTSDVYSVAYSPDGLTIASGSADSTVRIWNANTGAPMQTLEWYQWWRKGIVSFAAYSPNGQKVVSGSADDTIRVWNIATRPIASVSGPIESQTSAFKVTVAFSSAVAGFTSSDIVVTNGSVTNFAGSGAIYTATIEPSSAGAVTVSVPANAAANVWGSSEASNTYSADYRSQQVLTGHTDSVVSVAYSPDGQTIAAGSDDHTIRLWNADTGAHIRTLQGHTNRVKSVAYSPDGLTIASGSNDKTVRIWNADTGAHIRTLQGHTNWVFSAAYSPDGRTLASSSADDTIRIWNANTGAHLRTLRGDTSNVFYSAAYSPDGQTIASGGDDNTIHIWNANTGAHLRTLQGHTAPVNSVAYSPDGQTIASGGDDYKVRIWNANTGALIRTLQGHMNWVSSVAYSPDGQTIAAGSGDNTIWTWNADTGEHLATFRGHTDMVRSVAYSPDGQTIASGSSDNTIRIWDISDLTVPTARPTVIVSGPSEAPAGAFNVTILFSSAVTGFTSSDIVVTNGSATNLAGSGKTYTATIESSSAGAVTVSVPANAAGNNEASNTYSVNIVRGSSFTVDLRLGLNMLHVPVNDPQLKKMSDLYAALGGSQDVQFLVAYSPESNHFKVYTEGLAGSDLPLSDETAVIASMKSAKFVTFTGGLLKREVALRAGMNLIGVTRAGAVETIGDLASLSTVPLIVIALKHDNTGNALFQIANDSTDAAKGGNGYIILAEEDAILTFDGSAWSYGASTAAASAEAAAYDPSAYDPSATPLLVVEGSVAREDNLAPLNGLEISIANLQTGQTASDIAGRGSASGRFSLPLLALTGDSYAVGDAFDLRVSDSSGTFGGVRTVRFVLDKESVSAGRINVGKLLATAVPTESALLPNYPNPFNPETWIPFDLSEESRVAVTIYNAAGQTVRVLQLGELPAGTYRSRGKAAHWDGRNALGEPAASGVYYVRIEAGSFTALRRMVVLK